MQIFYRRPLCLLCVLFLFAMMAGSVLSMIISMGICLVLLIFALWQMVRIRNKRVEFWRGCMAVSGLLAVILGLFTFSLFYQHKIKTVEKFAGEDRCAEGQIISRDWGRGYYTGYTVHLTAIDGNAISADAILTCEYPANWQPGEVIRMNVEIETLSEDVNGFSERRYYHTRGVYLRVISHDSDGVLFCGEGSASLKLAFARLNELLSARIAQAVGHEEGALMSALFLARRDALSSGTVRDFGRLGLSHLLALSGLHLSLIVGLLKKLLGFLPSRSPLSSGIVLLAVGGYCLLTGSPISVLRAAAMLAIMEIFTLLWDEGDLQTALFLAVSLICLFSPGSLFDIGLWMSACATLGLILLSRWSPFLRYPRWLHIPLDLMAVSFVATLATLPMIWLIGGEFSLLFLPANLLFLPLVTGLLYGAPLAALLGRFGVVLCAPFTWLSKLTLSLAKEISSWRDITVSLQYDFLLWIIIPFSVIAVVFLVGKWKRKYMFVVLLCVLLVVGSVGVWIERTDCGLDLVCISEGKNETLSLQGENGALVIDFTDGSYSALYHAANQMYALGETEIEVLMLTHYHTKHIGAVLRLGDRITLRQIWAPYPETEREWEILLDLQENAERQGIEFALYRDGHTLRLGDTEIIAYTREKIPRSTQPLLLLQLRHGEDCVTYCGASIDEGAIWDVALSMIAESRTVIFGGHGPNLSNRYGISASSVLENVIFTSEEVFAYADILNDETAFVLTRANVFVGNKKENLFLLRLEPTKKDRTK
ncbi:MAG: DUF4131 domain-containing protein [Ruminococcaceae bacterium]|nr:DUF4131 domain-containing protein [Oscillospiraceae bacterium]